MFHRHRAFLAAILAVFLFRALAADAIVPPWQGPDEPTHFLLAKGLSLRGADSAVARAGVEGRILASMARHGWWEAYRQPTPQPLPATFVDVKGTLGDNVSRGTLRQPAYYVLGAAALWVAPSGDIETEYRLLRGLSLLFSVATLLCGWAGTRLLFGDAVAAGAMSVAALHPQFLLAALTVNPDALINLCGALLWWQGARLREHHGWMRALCMLFIACAGVVAALSKRNGVPLLVIAAALIVAESAVSLRAMNRQRAFLTVAVALLGVTVPIFLFSEWLQASIQQLRGMLESGLVVRRSIGDISNGDVIEFLQTAVDTSWLVAGWMRFPAPDGWLWVARVITLVGLLGSFRVWIQRGPMARPLSLAWLFVVLQVVPLLVSAFYSVSVPQGRYFFAVLLPLSALVVVGIQRLFPAAMGHQVIVSLITVVACLDVVGTLTVLIPAYL